MTYDQQPAVEAATGDNVMGKVLGTFDGLVDNATAAVGGHFAATFRLSVTLMRATPILFLLFSTTRRR